MKLFSHVIFFHADHVSEKDLLSFLSHKHVVVVVVPFLPVVYFSGLGIRLRVTAP